MAIVLDPTLEGNTEAEFAALGRIAGEARHALGMTMLRTNAANASLQGSCE